MTRTRCHLGRAVTAPPVAVVAGRVPARVIAVTCDNETVSDSSAVRVRRRGAAAAPVGSGANRGGGGGTWSSLDCTWGEIMWICRMENGIIVSGAAGETWI